MASLRILIADEHYLIRHGLKMLVESHPGWKICAEASTGREAVSAAKKLKPDIAILDISMPEVNGLEATKRIKTVSPNTEILILSMHYSQQLIQEILGAGARGYILESDSDRDLVIAVETIANHEPFPTPLTPGAVDSPSTVTLVDQADIEGMQRELAELIALVQQPLRQQLVGINEGKPDDPTAQDYIMEELFAVAVRLCEIDSRISERVAHVCWKIFTYLAPSKYDGLTPTTMAQLMSNMAKRVPQRYNSDPQTFSFLSVDLLSHSDQIFGTNYAEKLRDCLCRFSHLISKTHGIPPGKEESELREMEGVSKINQAIPEDANLQAEEESELREMEEVSKIKQAILEDANLQAEEESKLHRMVEALKIQQVIAAEDGVSQNSVVHDDLSRFSGTFKLTIERVRAVLHTILSEAIAIFSRISPSLQKVKHGVSQISVVHDDLSRFSGTFKLTIERVRAVLRTILSEAIAIFSRISPSLQKVKRWLNAPMK
jgi:DNA-binding NarL/FixJ family response regulator